MNNCIELCKMYYVPVVYYWLNNNNIYEDIKIEMNTRLEINKNIFYNNLNSKSIVIEKNNEYIEYKSNLIRLILIDHAHYNSNEKGKELLTKIFIKWNNNKRINDNTKKMIYERTINNVIKHEKNVNNIEEILMLINLKILENYYK